MQDLEEKKVLTPEEKGHRSVKGQQCRSLSRVQPTPAPSNES